MKTLFRPTILCAVLGSLAIVPHAKSNPFTPSSDFISAVEAGGTVSLYLDAAATDTSINYLFVSKDNSPTTGPQLNFNAQAAPEPGCATALVSGLGLLCGLRRRGVRG